MGSKTSFVCSSCGAAFPSWFGRCPECSEWGTLVEFHESKDMPAAAVRPATFAPLGSIVKKAKISARLSSGYAELDRVLGSGFVRDEVVLIAGEPGVGKSTLLLSVLAHYGERVVYVSTEEEGGQVAARAARLGVKTDTIYFSSEKNIDSLIAGLADVVKKQAIKLIIFDSLQGFASAASESLPGSTAQSKEVLLKIVEFVKRHTVTALVVGHVTKDGAIAGPKFLEHMVDCVLFLEGEKMTSLRLLRALKNRFGPTDEVGFFEMNEQGMQEVANPSQYFLEWNDKAVGKASVGVQEGARAVFVSVESLLVPTSLAFPKRVAKGIDSKRLELILAILKKYLHAPVDTYDVYVNIAGGLRISDPIADLGIAAAVYSSLRNKAYSPKALFLGEVGLLGRVRASNRERSIVKEARRLGFSTIYSAQTIRSVAQLKEI